MRPRAILAWFLERPAVDVGRQVLQVYGAAAGGLLANGLAFAALFAAVPATLLVLGLTGSLAAGDPAIRQQVADALVAALPPLAELIRDAVDALSDGGLAISIVGVVGLVWTVGQLFAAVDVAFARIFADAPERPGLWRTIRGLLVVAVLGAAVVAMIVGLGVVAALDAAAKGSLSAARDVAGLLGSLPVLLAIACLCVVVGYRVLPPRRPRWRALVLPGVVVGVVLVVLSQVFSYLVPRLVGAAALAGPLASGFVALAWLSLSFQAVLLGAAWVRIRDTRVRAPEGGPSAGSAPLERAATAAEPGRRGE